MNKPVKIIVKRLIDNRRSVLGPALAMSVAVEIPGQPVASAATFDKEEDAKLYVTGIATGIRASGRLVEKEEINYDLKRVCFYVLTMRGQRPIRMTLSMFLTDRKVDFDLVLKIASLRQGESLSGGGTPTESFWTLQRETERWVPTERPAPTVAFYGE